MPPTLGRVHDQEEDHFQHSKKLSVIAKVKEKAKKWRQSLIRRRHGHDGNNTPSWGVSLEDYEVEEDSEHLGAPVYESEQAPEGYKKNARQHPRADPGTSEKRVLGSTATSHFDIQERDKYSSLKKGPIGPALAKSYSDHQTGNSSIPKISLSETLRARSFGDQQRAKAPAPSKTAFQNLMTQGNAGQPKEKHSPPEMTAESSSAEITSFEDAVEQPNEKKSTTQNAIDKSTAYEPKENLPSPRKNTTQTLNDKSTMFEKNETLSSPRHATTQIVISKTTAYEQKEKLPSPKTTAHNVIDESYAYEQKEELSSPTRKDDQERENPLTLEKLAETEDAKVNDIEEEQEMNPPTPKKTITETVSEKLAPAYATVSEATQKITSKIQGLSMPSFPLQGTGEERKWDKGVSVKEYLRNKLEPGEDERALSQVISEAISPRTTPSEKGVVEKVKDAVNYMLHSESSLPAPLKKSSGSSTHIPVSTNAHEAEEETQGRILQAN